MVARADNPYSRFVAWSKIVLPLLALAILSTMFMLSKTTDPTQSIVYQERDAEGLARDQRIGSPNYSGVTNGGSAVTFSAESAHPNLTNPNQVSAEHILGSITTKSGRSISLESGSGEIDNSSREAKLTDGVLVTTSDGYRMETESLQAELSTTNIESHAAVSGSGPLGTFTAGKMQISEVVNPTGNTGYLLVFKDGVKLIYTPQGD